MHSERAQFTYEQATGSPKTVAGTLLGLGFGVPIFIPAAPVHSVFRDGTAVHVEDANGRWVMAACYTRADLVTRAVPLSTPGTESRAVAQPPPEAAPCAVVFAPPMEAPRADSLAPPDIATRLAGRRIVASISGGKDSAAMSLYLRELGLDHDRVFMDTGWESPKTYEYLRGELTACLGPITEIRSEVGGMAEWVAKKGMFPSKRRRFCTEELKVNPMKVYLERHYADQGIDIVNAVGIRRAESKKRSQMTEWEQTEAFDCEVWRPIISWSEQDVIDIHRRHNLRPNPLYLEGFSRVGCFPCIYARKGEIRRIAERYPERIDLLRALEDKAASLAGERYAAKGETFESLGYLKPSFFQSPLKDIKPCPECGGTGLRDVEAGDTDECEVCKGEGLTAARGATWPIDKIVQWSRTERGGRQMLLFESAMESAEDEGCMRWGLCDTHEGGDMLPVGDREEAF